MTTAKQEITNTKFMTDTLVKSIVELSLQHKESIKPELFDIAKDDVSELRSVGICLYDQNATDIIELLSKSADINWDCLVEKLNPDDIKSLKDALK